MSPSFETVEHILQATPRLSEILKDADRYLAHRDKDGKKPPELFEEHFDRVNKYFGLICRENGLDKQIDTLIAEYVRSFFPKSDFGKIGLYIKRLFVKTAVFHDFGKVNENFQAKKDKMNNPAFRMTPNHPLKHHHSKLGAYLYVVKHFQETFELAVVSKEEQRQLLLTILFFSYPIFRHHAPSLLKPDGMGIRFEPEELETMKKYLDGYQFQIHPDIAGRGMEPDHLQNKFFRFIFDESKIEFDFCFLSLLRLNFSLLTAADYIATGEYGYELILQGKKDWGILTEVQRKHICQSIRASKPFNAEAYHIFEQGNFQFQHPKAPNETNLNILRTEMSVQVLQQLHDHPDKRLFYLEAPTGGGKTNLSMIAVAELLQNNPELTKVFYVFPFTTLITQTHKNIKETLLLEDDEIALMHSKTGFQTLNESLQNKSEEEKEDGLYGAHRRDFLQNLFALYPLMMVTHIRFFDILKSNRKEDIYLMHRLANSIVVIDELQSYNPKHWDKMMYILDQYGKYFNIRFLLMSATLPRLDKIKSVRQISSGMPHVEDLLPNPKQYFINPNFKDRVRFNFDLMTANEEIDEKELASTVLKKSKDRASQPKNEGRVFTIIEFIFKKTATSFKVEIEALENFFDTIFVLSGTILESRRRQIINFLKRNRKTRNLKILLITTQVVEAGVDIDMDLGFKNVSLIDSDEQLAGRVNRNVSKTDCEVYLFKLNEPNILYGKDLRYKITRELPAEFHKNVLETKDFTALYERVFDEIDKRNQSELFANFKDEYLGYFKKLDFPEIDKNFRLIEQHTVSVFVPLDLPTMIENENGQFENFFSDFEEEFLKNHKVFTPGSTKINGAEIWSIYRHIMDHPDEDFISKKIERKVIQGILSKFTFSIFDSEKTRRSLAEYINPELSFESYLYLSDYTNIYDLESGLMESRFNDSQNSIL